jgi:hypothetical protein
MEWRLILGGFVVSIGFIGGWAKFGTLGGALLSSILLTGLFLADWMIDRYIYGL